jgi:antitoxin component of RelBE/YafQ-DinJ toxin-antitoxin module
MERALAREARAVAKEIGTSPGEIVRLMFKQMVKRRTILFPIHADTLEDEILSAPRRRTALWDEIKNPRPKGVVLKSGLRKRPKSSSCKW